MKSLLVECIGTFFLVLVIGLTVIAPGAGDLAPLAIGTILMVMVYAGGHVSGAHYNPAVTLAVWLRGKCDAKDVPGYMGAQVVGAVLAALLVGVLKRGSAVEAMRPDVVPALLVELVFTFALAYVVLNVATAKKTAGNSYFGLAIGFTVMAAAYAGGRISGGAFNPAVAIGLTLMGLSAASHLWIFLAANLAGGALAAFAFRLTNSDRAS
ncbi:MAG: porin [Omnitrophica bacterium RIFCSPHIGHO2_02_FULL_63_14]|nr:MAG: porin [Omnitrophica bacterium RIFCSPHIGHO2_02_FULL_63_14]